MSKSNLINEFYSKCLNQKQEIDTKVSEILKGQHNIAVLDKVKDKVLERLENFEESLILSEQTLNDLTQEDRNKWKK